MCDDRIDEKTGEIKEELKEVKEEQNKQKEEQHKQRESMENVLNKIDNLEQDKRLNNLLIRGIHPGGGNLKQNCISTLNKEMKVRLKTADLVYVTPIGKSEDKLVKLAFSDAKAREEVYSARSKLKGKDLWVTEDLTPKKSTLYYKARQCIKEGLGALTWTNNGKIFLKSTTTAKPKIINSEDDLPKPPPN
jgi:hypothetical protein